MQVIHVPFYKRSIQYPLQADFRAFIFFLRMKAHFSSENQMTQRKKNLVWRVKVDDCCLILFIQHIVIELSAECLVLGARCQVLPLMSPSSSSCPHGAYVLCGLLKMG